MRAVRFASLCFRQEVEHSRTDRDRVALMIVEVIGASDIDKMVEDFILYLVNPIPELVGFVFEGDIKSIWAFVALYPPKYNRRVSELPIATKRKVDVIIFRFFPSIPDYVWSQSRGPWEDEIRSNHRDVPPVPVGYGKSSPSSCRAIPVRFNRRRCIADQKSSLPPLFSQLTVDKVGTYRGGHYSCDSSDGAQPIPETVFLATAKHNLAWRGEKQIGDEHRHQRERPQPIPDACWLHRIPHSYSRVITTYDGEFQWSVAA